MKAFSRITALTISVAMIIASLFSVCVFADNVTFTDVSEDNQYSSAINSLVESGVINGYTEADGTSTFKPENTITRAEFAKVLVLSTTNGVALSATTSQFPDVSEDHWANTYIAAAVKTGAINGYEDGTFRPENPVSYGEAIKMIVCTLGYGKLVTPTDPWYDGYIKMANSINLTKGAASIGSNEAKRGLVAQLIYNIRDCKSLVQTGTDSNGNAVYSSTEDDTEDYTGIVTAVFETTLEGSSYGLTKQQIMIDGKVFYIGNYTIEKLLPYLGKNVKIKYEESSKKSITSIAESGKNSTITINDIDISDINGREITYYKDNKKTTVSLASDLYVIYNGRGVARSEITDEFINNYFNVKCGEITLLNNDGKSDYDIAYVTSYETFFVTGTTTTDNGLKIFDTYGPVKERELRTNDCTVYKVTDKSGNKTKTDSLSSIVKNSVVSIAAPYDQTDGTEVIVSTYKITGSKIDSKSNYVVTIGDVDYDISDYYTNLLASDSSKYGFSDGDSGTFYMDFKGRFVYFSKTESSDPYAYVIASQPSGGLSSNYQLKIFTDKGEIKYYVLKDKVKVNGSSRTPAEAIERLKGTAALINSPKSADLCVNADISQIIKYKTSGNYISEIFTINDSASTLESGNIVPGKFKADKGEEKSAFSKGKALKYNSSSKAFKDSDGNNQFTITTSTIVFFVPLDRSSGDSDWKKHTYSSFTDSKSYIAEPYDMTSSSAKAVVVYADPQTISATIKAKDKCLLVDGISSVSNSSGESVKKLTFYYAGQSSTNTLITDSKTNLDGIKVGDVIKVAQNGNDEITGVQKVFVDGVLYDWDEDDVFDVTPASGNYITHADGTNTDYYQVIYGTVKYKADDGNAIEIVPLEDTYNEDGYYNLDTTDSTVYYKLNDDGDAFVLTDVAEVTAVYDSSVESASKVVAIVMNKKVTAVYIIK